MVDPGRLRLKTEEKPFLRYEHEEGKAFYDNLPPPWNVRPYSHGANFQMSSHRMLEETKPSGHHYFDGVNKSYGVFRSLFIKYIRRSNLVIEEKYDVLRMGLAREPGRLVRGTDASAAGYALIIDRLERE